MTQLNAQALMAMPFEQMVACIKSWNRHKMEETRSWRFWRRNDQFEPEGDWRTWLVMAGRGYGKTRMGAEWVSALAAQYPGARFALVGATLNEARQVMVEGESGLLPLLAVTQAQKEITHNEALVLIDALLHTAVEGVALTAPALTDSDVGKCWLVGSGATGLWANKSGQIAIWIGGDWRYLVAHDGMRLWNRSNGRDSIYTGGDWRSGPIVTNPSGGAVVDAEARVAISAILQYFRLIGVLTA